MLLKCNNRYFRCVNIFTNEEKNVGTLGLNLDKKNDYHKKRRSDSIIDLIYY